MIVNIDVATLESTPSTSCKGCLFENAACAQARRLLKGKLSSEGIVAPCAGRIWHLKDNDNPLAGAYLIHNLAFINQDGWHTTRATEGKHWMAYSQLDTFDETAYILENSRQGFTRKELHPAIHYIWHKHEMVAGIYHETSYPSDPIRIALEQPHVSTDGRLAYYRDEKKQQEGKLTVTSPQKYLKRHFTTMPAHLIDEAVQRTRPGEIKILDDITEMVKAKQQGPWSCMQLKHMTVSEHPYQVYNPEHGWGMAVRELDGVVKAVALVQIPEKTWVRTYGYPDDNTVNQRAAITDSKMTDWFSFNGWTRADGWEGETLAKVTVRGRTLLPYIDGDTQRVDVDGDTLVITDDGQYRADHQDIYLGATDDDDEDEDEYSYYCSDCGDGTDEEAGHTRQGETICPGCIHLYTSVTGASSRGRDRDYYYVLDRDAGESTDGNHVDPDNLPEDYVKLAFTSGAAKGADYAPLNDCTDIDDEWYLSEDVGEKDDEDQAASGFVYVDGHTAYAEYKDCVWDVRAEEWIEKDCTVVTNDFEQVDENCVTWDDYKGGWNYGDDCENLKLANGDEISTLPKYFDEIIALGDTFKAVEADHKYTGPEMPKPVKVEAEQVEPKPVKVEAEQVEPKPVKVEAKSALQVKIDAVTLTNVKAAIAELRKVAEQIVHQLSDGSTPECENMTVLKQHLAELDFQALNLNFSWKNPVSRKWVNIRTNLEAVLRAWGNAEDVITYLTENMSELPSYMRGIVLSAYVMVTHSEKINLSLLDKFREAGKALYLKETQVEEDAAAKALRLEKVQQNLAVYRIVAATKLHEMADGTSGMCASVPILQHYLAELDHTAICTEFDTAHPLTQKWSELRSKLTETAATYGPIEDVIKHLATNIGEVPNYMRGALAAVYIVSLGHDRVAAQELLTPYREAAKAQRLKESELALSSEERAQRLVRLAVEAKEYGIRKCLNLSPGDTVHLYARNILDGAWRSSNSDYMRGAYRLYDCSLACWVAAKEYIAETVAGHQDLYYEAAVIHLGSIPEEWRGIICGALTRHDKLAAQAFLDDARELGREAQPEVKSILENAAHVANGTVRLSEHHIVQGHS